jgi:hypothetical protein
VPEVEEKKKYKGRAEDNIRKLGSWKEGKKR